MIRRRYRYSRKREEEVITTRKCDHEGCNGKGLYKAPKDRSLKEYYWFCEKHIKEYNENWNFYRGLSDEEIDKEISSSYVWDRPTFKFGTYDAHKTFSKAANFFDFFVNIDDNKQETRKESFNTAPEISKALQTLGLTLPLAESDLKSKYKELAKAYHPDLNSGNKKSEEMFKEISFAYQVLLKFLK
ncbi:MAG: Chaperone protein DnaJ [Alphaproteobacteria bacterium ADurb.Bin438]|nr:MAG: Chaperone protein DnaJ [Alphaproteobacteria bacterium ADurb.Bin438]